MKIQRNKTSVAALVLMLTMTVPLVSILGVNAQAISATHPLILAVPNPVGAGQPTLITFGITRQLFAVGHGWNGTITIEKPDATTETLTVQTHTTGIGGTSYVPATAGTYYLQYHFPQQDYAGTTYLASDSERYALTVTVEPVEYYPDLGIPTEYWTRPIDQNLRSWAPVTGNWIMAWGGAKDRTHSLVGNEDAPETAHILWETQLAMGGLAGGEVGDVGFETGDAYEGFFASDSDFCRGTSIIIGGQLYYNQYKQRGGDAVEQDVVCVDLHTGEELWVRNWNNTRFEFGQVFFWDSWNYAGVFPFIWTCSRPSRFGVVGGGTWNAYDPFTGRWITRFTDMLQDRYVYGPHGELLNYHVDLENGWMMLWNSTRVISTGGSFGRNYMGNTFNCSLDGWETRTRGGGWQWNKTIPTGLAGPGTRDMRVVYPMERMIGGSITNTEGNVWGINLKPGQEGQLLFNTTWTAPAAWTAGNVTIDMKHEETWMPASLEDKVGIIWIKDTKEHYGFSLDTGNLLWGPSEPMGALDHLEGTTLTSHVCAYGRLYSIGVSGIMKCFNVTTGETLWTYEAVDPYSEILYDNNWWLGIQFIADGKVYLGHGTHATLMPLARGAPFICLDAETGDEIWRANGLFRQSGWGGHAIIGDSIIALYDSYSQRIFGVGKGPSATTVSASPIVSVEGSSVVIEGTVTDISPGTEDYARTARFPNGVPAVADEVMSDWMLYVYKQFPCPANVAGVEVILETLDPNFNFYEIDRVTSDGAGMYKTMWEPPVPGEYTIIARFAGSESYWPSAAETAIGVSEAPPTPPPPPDPEEEPAYTAVDLAIIAAVVIAIVIGIINLWALRKRP